LQPEIAEEAARASKGLPLALSVIAEFVKSEGSSRIREILRGYLYDITDEAGSNEIASLAPRIISVTDDLVDRLRKDPDAIYALSPRRFEELLADLLTDMGWDVQLTRATRDGGKDLLAYLNTEVGSFLCLVEAKRYRRDRRVGVDLVRNLYGTLCDSQANSGMLVTTSSFSRDAREFQSRHSYQLSLREYADVVRWIERYKRGARKSGDRTKPGAQSSPHIRGQATPSTKRDGS
jgi:restriction endonuclease Mrr